MEHKELTTVADELAKSLYNVLGVLKTFDNGENCPACGREYDETVNYDGIFCGATANECYIIKAQKFVEYAEQTLHTFKLVCADLGVEPAIDLA